MNNPKERDQQKKTNSSSAEDKAMTRTKLWIIFKYLLPIVVSLAAGIGTIWIGVQQNDISNEMAKIQKESTPLSYKIDFSEDDSGSIIYTPQVKEIDSHTITGPEISVAPITGSITNIYFFAYTDGTIIPINLDSQLMDNKLYNQVNINEIEWRYSVYSVPIYAKSVTSDYSYGSLYVVLRDSQGYYHLNMITFTFDLDGNNCLDQKVFSLLDLSMLGNDSSFNEQEIGTFNNHQLEEFSQFKERMEQIIPNERIL